MAEQSADYIRTCYDAVAREYAERLVGELRHKPLDRELLSRLATEVSERGEVRDLGYGPAQTTAYLHGCELNVCGLDKRTRSYENQAGAAETSIPMSFDAS
jgi:hypothetical protein